YLNSTRADIRSKAVERLLIELLSNPKYKYFANENFPTKEVKRGVENYLRKGTLPPALDPKQTGLAIEEIAKRVLVRRYRAVLDFIRANPRYILSIGSIVNPSAARDEVLTQNFFGEFMAYNLGPGDAGVLLLGANHAGAVPNLNWS